MQKEDLKAKQEEAQRRLKEGSAAAQQKIKAGSAAARNAARQKAAEAMKVANKQSEAMGAVLVTRDIRLLQRNTRVMAGIIAGLLLIIVLLVLGLFATLKLQPEDRYFAATSDNRFLELKPMDEPSIGTASLLHWASRAIVSAHTFDFSNYRSQLQSAASEYFTSEGSQQWFSELKTSGTLARAIDNRYVVTTVLTAAPVILQQGRSGGVYLWRVQAPVSVTYENNSQKQVVSRTATITIVRSKEHLENGGIAISQFVLGAGALRN